MFLSAYASNIVCIFVLSFSLKEVIFSPVTFAKSPVGITRMVTVFSGSVFFLPKTNPPGGMIGFTARETARVARRPPCDPVERIDGFAAPPLPPPPLPPLLEAKPPPAGLAPNPPPPEFVGAALTE